MSEARLESGVPSTAGWFVINARDARWMRNDMRAVCRFGGEGEAHFDDLGVGLYWLAPGQLMSLYHHEAGQEDFRSCVASASSSSMGTSARSSHGTSSTAHPGRRTRSSRPAASRPWSWLSGHVRRREAPAIRSRRLLCVTTLECRTQPRLQRSSMPGSANLIRDQRRTSSNCDLWPRVAGRSLPPTRGALVRRPRTVADGWTADGGVSAPIHQRTFQGERGVVASRGQEPRKCVRSNDRLEAAA
jgi:hypothetical protein